MSEEVRESLPELPPDRVVIHDGRVQRIDEWCLWNGAPCMTIQIGRWTDEEGSAEGESFPHR